MSEQERPERPPTSGPGSGVAAWREYAAAVTGSPAESWAALSREEVIELLDSEGVEQAPEAAGADPDAASAEQSEPAGESAQPERPARRRGPVWMVPTAGGMVPEHELRRR